MINQWDIRSIGLLLILGTFTASVQGFAKQDFFVYPGIDELLQLCLIWQSVPSLLTAILEYPNPAVVDWDEAVTCLAVRVGHRQIPIFMFGRAILVIFN